MQEITESIGFCSVLSHAELEWRPGKFPEADTSSENAQRGPWEPQMSSGNAQRESRELSWAPSQFGMTQDTAKTNTFCDFLHSCTWEHFSELFLGKVIF